MIEDLKTKKGFIAAMDQSGGSSKKTLANYGVDERLITSDEVMFDYIHEMRSRIIGNDAFNSDSIIGAILFYDTMKRDIDGINTVEYLKNKGIYAFLKIDVGLEDECDGVRILKDIPALDEVLDEAVSYGVIGTKMRSVINEYNEYGIKKIVEQQFRLARQIIAKGLIPIIEPEVSIDAKNKKLIESFLRQELLKNLYKLKKEDYVIIKLTLPDVPNYYNPLLTPKNVLRLVALSGGYSREVACEKLRENKKMIASFSRALLESLSINQSDEEFSDALSKSIKEIYKASVTKKR